jgi:hypothetical protein
MIMSTSNRFYRASIHDIASILLVIACGAGSGISQAGSDIPQGEQTVGHTAPVSQRLNASGHNGNQGDSSANCSAFLPAEATTVDSFQLCQSDHSGNNELYACQNFDSLYGHYRVFFKGGRYPKAIATVAENGDVNKMLWSEAKQVDQPVCDFPPPTQIPAATKFIGAGVCEDNTGQPIPCTVFRHKAPRHKIISDHMVFYNSDGTGPEYTSTIKISVNHDAVPAELAYQIGLNLIKTQCCQQRGLQYIEYAYQLFPHSTLYRTTYQYFSQQASRGTAHPLTSSRLE